MLARKPAMLCVSRMKLWQARPLSSVNATHTCESSVSLCKHWGRNGLFEFKCVDKVRKFRREVDESGEYANTQHGAAERGELWLTEGKQVWKIPLFHTRFLCFHISNYLVRTIALSLFPPLSTSVLQPRLANCQMAQCCSVPCPMLSLTLSRQRLGSTLSPAGQQSHTQEALCAHNRTVPLPNSTKFYITCVLFH